MLPLEGRRSNIQIAHEILRLLRLGEAGKTEIMYTAKLSYRQTQRYLAWLSSLGLLDGAAESARPVSYRITGKGMAVLTKIEMVQEMLKIQEIPEILNAPEFVVKERDRGGILTRLGRALRGH